MPKKTKREKILAEYRRKLDQLEGRQSSINQILLHHDDSPQSSRNEYHISETSSSAIRQTNTASTTIMIPNTEFAAIKNDLRTTLILAGCMFLIELALWKFLP